MSKNPKHPVTKQELVGGFNPLDVSQRPFGFRETVEMAPILFEECDRPTMVVVTPLPFDGPY